MSYPPNSTPGAPDDPWSTPARPPDPPVSVTVATHAVTGISPIAFPGDADPGGRDTVAGSVAEAVSNAEARYTELQGDTYGQGTIGDLMDLPPTPSEWSRHTGGTDATSYDQAG